MKTLVAIYNYNMPDLTDQLYEALKPYENNEYDLMKKYFLMAIDKKDSDAMNSLGYYFLQ